MTRAIVNYATGERYLRGLQRLERATREEPPFGVGRYFWGALGHPITKEWPSHQQIPYGFKAYALKLAAEQGYDLLLWADASILPIRSLEPLWERIERNGYWMSINGDWGNHQWTCDAAYPDLFPNDTMEVARAVNGHIPHVVATTFGLNVKSEIGKTFLDEYYRLASETKAFCGPWWNSNGEREDYRKNAGAAPCGPPECLGHRHDQVAASVIAWRLGMVLDQSKLFTYRGEENEETILLADGAF